MADWRAYIALSLRGSPVGFGVLKLVETHEVVDGNEVVQEACMRWWGVMRWHKRCV